MKKHLKDPDFIDAINKSRGYIITKAVILEQLIDNFITVFFIGMYNDKERRYKNLILSHINFNDKANSFKALIKPYVSNDDFKFIKDAIQYIHDTRNKVAHRTVIGISTDKEGNEYVAYVNSRKTSDSQKDLEHIGDDVMDTVCEYVEKFGGIMNDVYAEHFYTPIDLDDYPELKATGMKPIIHYKKKNKLS